MEKYRDREITFDLNSIISVNFTILYIYDSSTYTVLIIVTQKLPNVIYLQSLYFHIHIPVSYSIKILKLLAHERSETVIQSFIAPVFIQFFCIHNAVRLASVQDYSYIYIYIIVLNVKEVMIISVYFKGIYKITIVAFQFFLLSD